MRNDKFYCPRLKEKHHTEEEKKYSFSNKLGLKNDINIGLSINNTLTFF